jgi:hypothetical protein
MTDRVISSNTGTSTYEAAIGAGMTVREAQVFDQVSKAAGAYLTLTDKEPHHVMERQEICQAFHVIQGWLASRPTIRKIEELTR